jgi:hypothetical protein
MRVEKNLSFVIPLERDDGRVYIYSSPVSYQTFEEYFMIFTRTFNVIVTEAMSAISGPRVAALIMQKIAKEEGSWDGPNGVAMLFAEMHRNTLVSVPTPRGNETMAFDDAVKADLLDQRDVSEVDGKLVFFMVVWHMRQRDQRLAMLDGAARLWGASLTSLGFTEYVASQTIVTPPESIGASPPAESSVPS